jgi:hypothetical protein
MIPHPMTGTSSGKTLFLDVLHAERASDSQTKRAVLSGSKLFRVDPVV